MRCRTHHPVQPAHARPAGSLGTSFGIAQDEPLSGAQFNDIGLVLDAAVAGFGVALMRLQPGSAWLDSGRLVRLSPRPVASPHHHFLCWKPGAIERRECAAFVDWLRHSLV